MTSSKVRLLSIAARIVPFTPPLVLLALIHRFGVNVPFWDEWDVIPFVVKARTGALSFADFWMQHNEHRFAAVKLLILPLARATDFDVTALMYAGFGLQLLAFLFLRSLLEFTLRPRYGQLILPLALTFSLLMFSPAQYDNWVFGLPSLQWHLCNLTAAASVWLIARYPEQWFSMAVSFVLTCAGTLAIASGMALWGVVLVAFVTQGLANDRLASWQKIGAWAAGALALGAGYFAGFHRTSAAPTPSFLLTHPLDFGRFALVYLGWPLAQDSRGFPLLIAEIVGLVGLLTLVPAVAVSVGKCWSSAKSILPWLWLSTYALLVALLTAAGRASAILTATTNRYTTGSLFFWLGLIVIAGVAICRLTSERRGLDPRVVRLAAVAVVVACGIDYARLYRDGYRVFVQGSEDRRTSLAELYTYETASDEALTYLYPPSAEHVRERARVLERERLGPFSSRMDAVRSALANRRSVAPRVVAGEGVHEVADCIAIRGWAWDREHPDESVNVNIYGDGKLLATVPAYWFRWDLADGGIGSGRHAFLYKVPANLRDGRKHRIRVLISGTAVNLVGTPKPLVCSGPPPVLWR